MDTFFPVVGVKADEVIGCHRGMQYISTREISLMT